MMANDLGKEELDNLASIIGCLVGRKDSHLAKSIYQDKNIIVLLSSCSQTYNKVHRDVLP
jgi:hypothetical protein